MKYNIRNINKKYNDDIVLKDISIVFEEYKTTCILGESGAGKTTLLNIIAGIVEKDSGEIIGFKDEDISFVFQEDRLIPWKNVEDNLSFVLHKKMTRIKAEEYIHKYLKLVNLEEYKHYYPKELSGGMRQRISILRAFIYPSNILIMDEAFKSLDVANKKIVLDLFKRLRAVQKKTCILVTHDIDEALDLGDKIIVFSNNPARVKGVIENISDLKNKEEIKTQVRELIENKK